MHQAHFPEVRFQVTLSIFSPLSTLQKSTQATRASRGCPPALTCLQRGVLAWDSDLVPSRHLGYWPEYQEKSGNE